MDTQSQPPASDDVFRKWLAKLWPQIRKGLIPGLLALYLNFSLLIWGLILMDIATGSFGILKLFGYTIPRDPQVLGLLKLTLYAAIGGAVGGLLYGMQSLWKHTKGGTFAIVYIGDYLFRQFGSAALAVIVFALLRGGLLSALGAETSGASVTATSSFSTFAIGALAGFGSYRVIQKFDDLIQQLFQKSSNHRDSSSGTTDTTDTTQSQEE